MNFKALIIFLSKFSSVFTVGEKSVKKHGEIRLKALISSIGKGRKSIPVIKHRVYINYSTF